MATSILRKEHSVGILSEIAYDHAYTKVCHMIDDELFDHQDEPNVVKVLQKLREKVSKARNNPEEVSVIQRTLPGIKLPGC